MCAQFFLNFKFQFCVLRFAKLLSKLNKKKIDKISQSTKNIYT